MKLLISLAATTLLCTSCYHVYYAPNTANAPLLAEKGETRINALYTTGGDSDFDGGELQLAHAVGKHVGIMINGLTAGKSEEVTDYSSSGNNSTQTEKGSGSYIELAGGLFKNFDNKKKWIGEIYGGIGYGSVKNDYGSGDHSKVSDTKVFLQPAIGYKSRNFEVTLSPKVSLVNWKVKENRISSFNEDVKDELNYITQNPRFFIFEPALLLRGGGKNVKLQLGISFSDYDVNGLMHRTGLTETLNSSLGVSINLKPSSKRIE
jgi:hypothetical protein